MSLVRLLPAWFHAVADYAVGLGLIIIAIAVGGSGKAVAAGVVVGATVLVVSMLTRYPLGVAKVLPFTVHSAGDYLAARSEEHTSELQSRGHLVCRLLLEKKKQKKTNSLS